MRFTFHKEERLSGTKTFERLMRDGEQFFSFPFRVLWQKTGSGKYAAQVAFAVPKRNFRRAVKRNRIKRLLREAYRLHKGEFYEALNKKSIHLQVMFIYTQRGEPSLRELEAKIVVTLSRLVNACDAADNNYPKT